ncbi:MAG: CAP domain-containing protein [Paludibacteraceae bacterium]|nr:CAP domain-containing protein [Paludibacteraceae bacterium]
MKRISILLAAVMMATVVMAQWTMEMYDQYTYADYTTYAPFNQSLESTDYDIDLLETAVFYETNRQRALNGLSQLQFDYNLMVCAHNHSVDMVNLDFFSHTSPVEGKTSFTDRMQQVGYDRCWSAENIAYCAIESSYAETAKHLLNQWMNSSGHRKNILNPRYTHIGCGTACYLDGGFVYVKATQNFMEKK